MLGEYEALLSKMGAPRATATEIKNFLEQPRFVGEDLHEYAQKYIAELKNNGQDSYAQNMGYTLKYLTECLSDKVAFSSINTNTIRLWEKWLIKMGYSPTTINIRMSHLSGQ